VLRPPAAAAHGTVDQVSHPFLSAPLSIGSSDSSHRGDRCCKLHDTAKATTA
jgi:hypothetical protein